MNERKPPHSTYGLYEDCEGCAGCPTERNERELDLPYSFGGFVLPVIKEGASILGIGDWNDRAERKRGEVFSGQTGYWWARVIRSLNGVNRNEFSLANVISCQPPRDWRKYKEDAAASIEQCQQYLHTIIERTNPDVIMTLGELPTNTLLGGGELVQGHAPRRGYVMPAQYGNWSGYVVPSVHPRRLGQGKAAWFPLLAHDILTARLAQSDGPEWMDYTPEYVEAYGTSQIETFIARAKRYFAIQPEGLRMFTADIETAESGKKEEADYDEIDDAEITRISFAYRPGYAISIPWTPAMLPWIQKVFDLQADYIVYWNWTFDHPRLLAKGIRIRQKIFDGMELFHYWKTALPKSLGSVTPNVCRWFAEWKSLFGVDLSFYSCVDSDAAISNVDQMIKKMPQCQFDAFMSHWIKTLPINEDMHNKGMLFDVDKQDELRTLLINDLNLVDDDLQELIPERIKPFKMYQMPPIAFRCRECAGKGFISKSKTKTRKKKVVRKWKEIVRCEACNESGYVPENIPEPWTHRLNDRPGYFIETSVEYLPNFTGKNKDIEVDFIGEVDKQPRKRWGFKQKFLPTSPKHVANYLRDCGYPIPRNYQTDEETTDVKAITDLMKKHPKDLTLPKFLEYRQIKKSLGQYVDGYVPWEDGRIHTTFGQKAANLRYNSIRPNVQNITQKGKYAQLIRQQFIPSPGHVLAELDHSGAEAQIVGFYAHDPDYIRIAKLSIHGILASYVLVNEGEWANPIDLKWSDDDITAAVEEIQKHFPLAYRRSKNCVHGSNYGAVPYKLFMEYREAFPTLAFAEEIQELYFGTIARGVKQWHHDTWEFAYKHKYIENVYGYRFDFWDVLSPNWYGDLEIDDRTGYWKLGDQAKDCLAFNPSSTEAGLIKDIMIYLYENTDVMRHLVWMIHDSLVFELPNDHTLESNLKEISGAMAYPVKEMDGLSIECGIDVGTGNWGKFDYDNPDANPNGMKSWKAA